VPRFHFHVHDGVEHPDPEGSDLPDIPSARKYAVRYFGEMLQDEPSTFWNGEELRMQVADETGLLLFSLHFIAVNAPVLEGVGTAKALDDPGVTILPDEPPGPPNPLP
jgi:hypothetical protein